MTEYSRRTRAYSELQATTTRRAHETAHSRCHDSLTALHRLEAALGAPAPGRQTLWIGDVRQALADFSTTLRAEQEAVCGPDGLFHRVREEEPRLAHDAERLQGEYAVLGEQTERLAARLEAEQGGAIDIGAYRRELAELLDRYRQLRASEADLVFDAYHTDLGFGD